MTTTFNCFSVLFPFLEMAHKVLTDFNGKMTTMLEKPLGGDTYLLEIPWKRT